MSKIYEILLSTAEASNSSPPAFSQKEGKLLNLAATEVSTWLKEILEYPHPIGFALENEESKELLPNELVAVVFKFKGEHFKIFFPKDLVNLIASLVRKTEHLPIQQSPGDEELTIFSYLVAKILSKAASENSLRVYLSAVSPLASSKTVSEDRAEQIKFSLEIAGEIFPVSLELSGVLKNFLHSFSRFKLADNHVSKSLLSESITHRLSLESGIASLEVISSLKQGARIKLGENSLAQFSSTFEQRKVKVEMKNNNIKLMF